ncbi:hypothetical protein FALBO_4798 [Fusarium albosuccineum]|uniref:Uncharacterized protein n=1 Tax=Fusarium albosuccineum TaxID=1237068 RepID=A0A8H4PDB4_9HYPO|nr:hypothetical protein FALBO_4798 [Fusarium albosuccineum]
MRPTTSPMATSNTLTDSPASSSHNRNLFQRTAARGCWPSVCEAKKTPVTTAQKSQMPLALPSIPSIKMPEADHQAESRQVPAAGDWLSASRLLTAKSLKRLYQRQPMCYRAHSPSLWVTGGVPADPQRGASLTGRGEAPSYSVQDEGVERRRWCGSISAPLSSEVLSTPDGPNVAQFESTRSCSVVVDSLTRPPTPPPPSTLVSSAPDETSHLRRVAVVQPDWAVHWSDRAPWRYTLDACAALGRLGLRLGS